MRLLTLENFGTVQVDPILTEGQPNQTLQIYGASRSLHSKTLGVLQTSKNLQVFAQSDEQVFSIDIGSLEITKLDEASFLHEESMSDYALPDGSAIIGISSITNNFYVLVHGKNMKEIPRAPGMKLGTGFETNVLQRILKSLKNFFGVSTYYRRVMESSRDFHPYRRHFPLIAASPDGLILLCYCAPGEAFIHAASYPALLKHMHVKFLVHKISGQWWKVGMDQKTPLNWLYGRCPTKMAMQIVHNDLKNIRGTIVYAAFTKNTFEILYGIISNSEERPQYKLEWKEIEYSFDWVILDDRYEFPGEKNFIVKVSSNGKKVAFAANTYLGAYIHVQDLPASSNRVKLDRVNVPLCSHCDHGDVLYYEEDCWISDIEWLTDNCYFACTTRCGCLSIFYKSGELMVLNIMRHENLNQNPPCNYFQQVFDTRMTENSSDSAAASSNRVCKTSMKYSGLPENILTVLCDSKLYLFSIKRVCNYDEASNVKSPVQASLSIPKDRVPGTRPRTIEDKINNDLVSETEDESIADGEAKIGSSTDSDGNYLSVEPK